MPLRGRATSGAGLKRVAAGAVLCAGLLALAAGAVASVWPPSASLSLASRFWRAGPVTRLLNVPFFSADVELSAEALRAGRALPDDADVLLVLPRGTTPDAVEEKRRRAAYLLSPRRVVVTTGDVSAFRLEALRSAR